MRIMNARGVVMGLAIAGLAACGSSGGGAPAAALLPPVHTTPPAPAAPTITGTIELNSSDVEAPGDGSCDSGTGGYEDIDDGAQVTLTNEMGTILGTTQLGAGTAGDAPSVCDFSFTFGQVAAKAKFYSVQVSHRGQITDSAAELKGTGWVFSLTLGDGS